MKGSGDRLAQLSPERRQLLERMLAERMNAKRAAQAPPEIRRRGTEGPAPLSFGQQRLWFIDRLQPGRVAYNMSFPLRIRGGVELRALERALSEIVRRHETLRTRFEVVDGEPVQVVREAAPVVLPVVELGGLLEEARDAELARLAREEARRPFDLAVGPLLRAVVVRLGPMDAGVLFTLHHIVCDGWSLGILVREISTLYAAFARGAEVRLPELPIQYADYAVWQREWLSGETLEAEIGWWREGLAGVPTRLELPTDRPHPAVAGDAGGVRAFRVGAGTTARLHALSRREGATPFMTLLAAWQLLLGRYSGEERLLVGTPIAGRNRVETEGLIGFFVNTLVLRADLAGDPTFRDLLHQARERTLGAYAHQDLPFEKLVEELGAERSLAHTPLFQVMFALQNNAQEELELDGAGLEGLGTGSSPAKFDLALSLTEAGDEIRGGLTYRTALWEGATIGRMLEHYARVLEAAVAHPERRLSEISLLDAAERSRVLEEWNAGARAVPRERCVHQLFTEQAGRTPHAPAVLFGAQRITYAELETRSNRLAHALRRRGAGPETRVGLCLERTPELLVGVLGILKAGAGYVPVDPDYPPERIAYVLADAQAPFLVARSGRARDLPASGAEVLRVDAEAEWSAAGCDEPPAVGVEPENLAYVIYTSGSTGRPKGVRIEHRSLSNTLRTARDAFGFGPGDEMPSLASIAFDIWLFETLLPLLCGAVVRIVPRERVVDVAALVQELEGATLLHAVPALMRQVVQTVRAGPGTLPRLRRAFVGGDAVAADLLAEMRAVFPAAEVYVTYGPTEGTIVCAAHPVTGGEAAERHLIGAPLGNAPLYVLDRDGAPAPVGVPGELCIGGVGVARDYLGRPELTAERFVPDPYSGEPGARLYRTGDRTRWLAAGELEFLGRMDAQVKVRGFRIEPGEIEAALRAHDAVGEAAVVAREDARGERCLVGYLVPAEGERTPSGAELRTYLGERLPEYMVPGVYVALEALPLTPSGKLDRRALPAPEWTGGEAHVAPRTAVEEIVAGIWAGVLGVERVGVHDDFFALGGHSLLATRLIARIGDAVGVEVPLRILFDAPTVAGMAAYVERQNRTEGEGGMDSSRTPPAPAEDGTPAPERAGGTSVHERFAAQVARPPAGVAVSAGAGGAEAPAGAADREELLRRLLQKRAREKREAERIRPRGTDGPVPLSFAQQRLWFIQQMEPRSAAYHMPYPLRLRGALDPRAVQRAFDELVRRHESLRTVFAMVDGEPVQVVRPAAPVAIPRVELGGLSGEAREREVQRLAAEETGRPFDLARGPLLRVLLLRMSERDWGLVLVLHHIVSDGWSMGVLVSEVSTLYEAYARGEESPLPELPVQYPDFALWQRTRLSAEALQAQVAWWRTTLAGAPPVLELPTDRPRSAAPGARGDSRALTVPSETARRVREMGRAEGTTSFVILLAAFQALLGRYAGQEDVSVGTVVAGRNRTEMEGLIGFFVNTLVLRADLSGDPTGLEMVRRVREGTLGAFAHQDVPFEKLVEELQPERSLRHTPLFQVMFALQNAEGGELHLGELQMEPLSQGEEIAKFDLSLSLQERDERIGGALSFRTDLFEGSTIERMAEHFRTLLDALTAAPERPLSELSLLGDAERRRVLEEWNATGRGYPAGLRVHDLFRAQVARTPDAVAVVAGDRRLSYAELDRRAARLANALRRRGVGPESRVGVCLARTPELLAALLGVLRAGGTYVPLDPAYPQERIGYMLEDAGIDLVLTESALAERIPGGTTALLVLDHEREALAREPEEVPESGVLPENLSHVIFTSGSTGRPKGVMIRHASTVVLLHWLRETVTDAERASVLFSTSVSFDVSVAEIFGTLCWGGKLVLVENALELASVQEPVVYASMVPSAAAELLRSGGIPASVRTLNLGGEALPNPLAQALYALGTVERVGNLYGPTEDTTYSTYSLVERGGDQVFVGRPVANTQAYVLDARLRPVPAGVIGELYLAGDGVARGYVGRPELTAERFLPNPFGAPGSRMYRVMDRVRWRADGVLEYFGRTDFQVKVRGFRIELGEIEAVLGRHPAVGDTVVTVREDVPGDRRIVAYVTAAPGAEPSPAELRAHVGAHLPEYMVPAAVVVLEAMPLSPNGKIDRRALPAPDWMEQGSGGGYLPPRDALELVLAGIWEEVLGTRPVGVRDSFFERGGHSLLAVRLMARVEEATGARLPLAVLFTAPTVETLAEVLRREQPERDASPLVPIRAAGERRPLFLVHAVGGDVLSYAPLAAHLPPEQPLYGLRSRGLAGGGAPHTSVEAMAADYLEALRAAQPRGPYRLGGWSMGGVVAFEMARRLEAAGERVERLLLIDAHLPALHGRTLPDDPTVRVRIFAQDMGLPLERLALPEGETEDGEGAYLRRALEEARAAGLVPPYVDAGWIEQLYGVFRANLEALYAYRPREYRGAVTLLRAAEHHPSEAPDAGWGRIAAGGVEVRSVPGSHFTLVRGENARALARELAEALEGTEGEG